MAFKLEFFRVQVNYYTTSQKVAELSFMLQVLQNIVVSQLHYTTQTLHASETVILSIYYL